MACRPQEYLPGGDLFHHYRRQEAGTYGDVQASRSLLAPLLQALLYLHRDKASRSTAAGDIAGPA